MIFTIPGPVKMWAQARHDVNWRAVVIPAIEERCDALELADPIAAKSKLTPSDVDDLADLIHDAGRPSLWSQGVKLVVDATHGFSALLRDGEARRALFTKGAKLFAPAFLRGEVERHRPELVRRSGHGEAEFRAIVEIVFASIGWVPRDAGMHRAADASAALSRVDADDVPYLACALVIGADAGSHDKHFDEPALMPPIPHPDALLHRGVPQAGDP